MLILKGLHWSNCFSYGEGNYIPLDSNRVTQLIGKNGHGKSSIPLILQEALFNKNSKGTKKAEVPNRNMDRKGYDIAIEFELDNSEYFFRIERKGATTKTELLKDGEEIGAHTATATYKQVTELLGIDFSTFCQLVYQSANSSLEFLTATDTQRKKFLISLLNLGDYTADEIKIKKVFSEVNNELTSVQSSVETINSWLNKNKEIDTVNKEIQEVPDDPKNLREELATLEHQQKNRESINLKITKQEKTLKAIEELKVVVNQPKPIPVEHSLGDIRESKGKVQSIKANAESMINKLNTLKDKCPTCLSKIDQNNIREMIATQNTILKKCADKLGEVQEREQETNLRLSEIKDYETSVATYDRLVKSIDPDLPEKPIDDMGIRVDMLNLRSHIKVKEQEIKDIQTKNTEAVAHNTKILYVLDQTSKYESELLSKTAELTGLQKRLSRLSLLKRAFSTKGLVAYKIESMVKDLEKLINQYLIEISDGRFNLAFVVSGDKLNVDILDNGQTITVNQLSSGELARVNIATLLAIRKLMNTLSNTKLNLLFLDEVTSVLDEEGRERLVEILNKEQDINAFIVSHGWQHPLVEKIEVIKEDKISRIEY